MARRMWIGVAALLLMGSVAQAEPMALQYQANLERSPCEALSRGADFLTSAQVADEVGRVGWSWKVGDAQPADNQAGLVSLGLLDAHGALGGEAYLHAAERYAESLVARIASGDSAYRAYKPDIELLARLGKLQAQPQFLRAARELFTRQLKRAPDGQTEVARIAAGRKDRLSLLGFDVALGIRPALRVEHRQDAYQLADALVARSAQWYRPRNDPRFSLLSAAALIPTLEALDRAHFAPLLARLRADLLGAQWPSGSWLSNETQLTAYAVLALADSPRAEEREAARRGAAWLKSTALRVGAHATFNDFMPEPFVGAVLSEVSAEAMQALALSCREELRRSP